MYDRAGNLLSDGTNTYVYDAANRLSSVTNTSGTTTYAYNGDNDRVSQSVNGTLTTYILDTATPLTMVLAESTGASTTRYWHGLDTLAQSDGTTTETFVYDGLGSVRQLVDASGSVGLAQTFDPYGNGYAKAGSAGSSFGYSGEQVDANGFVFLRARYYNPAHGRFFQRDTWSGNYNSPLTMNPYLYSLGNPVMFSDPSGHCVFAGVDTLLCAMLTGALIGGAIGASVAWSYAQWLYTFAERGMCDCVDSTQILAFTRAQFVYRAVLAGAALGIIFGAVSAIGAGPALASALLGMGLSGTAAYFAAQRVIDNPSNACAWLDLGVSTLGLFASAYGALKSFQIGMDKGWINKFPSKTGGTIGGDVPEAPSDTPETPPDTPDGIGGGGRPTGVSLNEYYSNVDEGIAKPMFKDASANAGNPMPSRLDEVPAFGKSWSGQTTNKALGILEVPGQGDIYLQSDVDGPGQWMPQGSPGFDAYTKTHVEGHAAAAMHYDGITKAILYINKVPCGACSLNLKYIVPLGAVLEVIGPNGYHWP